MVNCIASLEEPERWRLFADFRAHNAELSGKMTALYGTVDWFSKVFSMLPESPVHKCSSSSEESSCGLTR